MNKKWKKKCKSSFKGGKCAGCAECGAFLSDDNSVSDEDDDDMDGEDDGLSVCLTGTIGQALKQMDSECQDKVYSAVANDVPLDAVQRCTCYLQVDPALASGMNCKTMDSKTSSLAEEYAVCVDGATDYALKHNLCNMVDLNPLIKTMTPECQGLVDYAIAHNTPLTEDQRCKCYLEVDAASMQSLNCRTMEVKDMTVAEEFQQCSSAKLDQ